MLISKFHSYSFLGRTESPDSDSVAGDSLVLTSKISFLAWKLYKMCFQFYFKITSDLCGEPGSCQGCGDAARASIKCSCVGIAYAAFHKNWLKFTVAACNLELFCLYPLISGIVEAWIKLIVTLWLILYPSMGSIRYFVRKSKRDSRKVICMALFGLNLICCNKRLIQTPRHGDLQPFGNPWLQVLGLCSTYAKLLCLYSFQPCECFTAWGFTI